MKSQFRKVYPAISRETMDEQSRGKRYNPASVATFKGKRFTLANGSADDLNFWSDASGKRLYCLCVNYGLGYVGLEAFDTSPLSREETHEESDTSPTGEKRREMALPRESCGDVFFQNAREELDRPDMESDPCDLASATLFALCLPYC